MNIIELMEIPAEQHDSVWLKNALQNAVKLELATIPPYLLALWSIENDNSNGFVTDSLTEIALEEMAHLGLVCNMLTTIGETPDIFPGAIPTYPGPLPGGVKPGLEISLRKLSLEQLEIFKEIEAPEQPFEPLPLPLIVENLLTSDETEAAAETFPTIGKFYDAVEAAFQKEANLITGAGQLKIGFGFQNVEVFAINTIGDVQRAIKQIKNQGEGTSQTDPEDGDDLSGIDLAHFYRFREISDGHRLIKNAAGEIIKDPTPLPFPDVFNIADVPKGGFLNPPASVINFDRTYTNMIKLLHEAWKTGDKLKLRSSVSVMRDLTDAAAEVIRTPIPNDPNGKTFAPSFLSIL